MFVTNLNQELGFDLQILCASTFEEVIDKGTAIERALIAKGSIKLYDYKSNNNNNNNNKPNNNTPNTNNNANTQSNDKPRYWGKNKNNLNDSVTDVKAIQHVHNQTPAHTYATNVNNQRGQTKPRKPRRQFTPLGEQIEDILDRCLKQGIITLPPVRPCQENEIKVAWYNENDYCEYHSVVGHKTVDCMQLKHCVQDLIDQNQVNLDQTTQPSPNANLGAYKDPLPNHNKASSSNQAYNVTPPPPSYDSIVGRIEPSSHHVNTITIQAQAPNCTVTTRRGRVSIHTAPTSDPTPASLSNPPPPRPTTRPSPTNQYSLLEHLGKTSHKYPSSNYFAHHPFTKTSLIKPSWKHKFPQT